MVEPAVLDIAIVRIIPGLIHINAATIVWKLLTTFMVAAFLIGKYGLRWAIYAQLNIAAS